MKIEKLSFLNFITLLSLFIIIALSLPLKAKGNESIWRVTKYEIDVSLDPAREYMTERAKIEIEASTATHFFKLALNENLHVLNVKPSYGVVDFRKMGEVLMVSIDPPIEGKNTITVDLEGRIKSKESNERKPFLKDSIMLSWSDLWYPFSDEGWAKSLIRVTLPEKYKVIGPGKEISRKESRERVTYIWQDETGSSRFTVLADSRWNIEKVKRGALEIKTYLYPGEDTLYAERIISSSTDVINYYSKIFCPYPFHQFAIVELEGLSTSRALNGFIAYSPEYLIKIYSSEGYDGRGIAHLWWGQAIAGKGKGGKQWIEGFGDYAEYLYCEHARIPLSPSLQLLRDEYFLLDSRQDIPFSNLNGQAAPALIHGKGPAIMEMMRYIVGDSRFFKALKWLFKEKLFSSITLEEFQLAMESGTGRKLQTFFNDWIYRSGTPMLEMEQKIRETIKGGQRVDLKIRQLGQTYTLPVEILMTDRKNRKVEKLEIKDRESSFFFIYDFEPKEVILDPQNKIFRWEEKMEGDFQKLSLKQKIDRDIQKAAKLERIRDYDEAEKIYENSLKDAPDCRELLYNYARMEQTRKNYRKAIHIYEEAAQGKSFLRETKDPLLPWSYIRKGNTYDLLGEREKALEEYKQVFRFPDLLNSRKMAERYIKEPYKEK